MPVNQLNEGFSLTTVGFNLNASGPKWEQFKSKARRTPKAAHQLKLFNLDFSFMRSADERIRSDRQQDEI